MRSTCRIHATLLGRAMRPWAESDPAGLDAMRRNFVPWAKRMIGCGKYVGWVVEDGGRAVASGGFFELEWPPHPLDPAGEHRGYLHNFWVEPAYREQGLARGLVHKALAESRRRGIRVTALQGGASTSRWDSAGRTRCST